MRECLSKNIGFLVILLIVCTSCMTGTPDQSQSQDGAKSNWPPAANTTWVFEGSRYAGFNSTDIMTATCTVTETVVDSEVNDDFLAVRIQRVSSAETLVSPNNNALTPSDSIVSSEYWLVFTDTRVYRQDGNLDLSTVDSTGTLELVFPLEVGEKWYLTAEMDQLYPDQNVDSMLRKVQRKETVNLPAGQLEGCFFLEEVIGGSVFGGWFCPGMGWVERRSDHHGTPYGWRELLVEYRIEK
jgi:hypothetical protein